MEVKIELTLKYGKNVIKISEDEALELYVALRKIFEGRNANNPVIYPIVYPICPTTTPNYPITTYTFT